MASSSGKGAGAVKLVVISIVAYVAGVVVSPYILPIDFVLSKLQQQQPPVSEKSKQHRATSEILDGTILDGTILDGTILDGAVVTSSVVKSVTSSVVSVVTSSVSPHESPYKKMMQIVDSKNSNSDPFYGVEIVVHRNGESDPCDRQLVPEDPNVGGLSQVSTSLLAAADKLWDGKKPLDAYDKYDFDAILTHALVGGLGSPAILLDSKGHTCGPARDTDDGRHYTDSAPHLKDVRFSDMIKFCDMGPDKTTIQLDHRNLVRVPDIGTYPCHFHTREGVRILSLEQLAQFARDAKSDLPGECTEEERNVDGTCDDSAESRGGDALRQLHLYAVQASRQFIFAPRYVGEIFELPHVKVPNNLPVWLEVMSLQPRVFDIFNFFDRAESAAIVDKAMKETSETHRMKRSSTGASGYNVNSQRTSENGFDTHGTQAQAVKRRCMTILGFDEYEESLTDGLQVLRYNKTTAYIPHLDWIDDVHGREEHNFDTEHLGSNRFATILLYMSDLEEGDGGETVFSHGWPPQQAVEDRVQFNDALAALRESGDVEGLLDRDSWQEKMVARCRSRLAVRPHSSRAVLFYSQNPDGTVDSRSMHGGCPVVKGEKWAANLWVWNAPRGGFPGSPKNHKVVEQNQAAGKSPENDLQKKASFDNTKTDESMIGAQLYFQDTFWGNLGFGDSLSVNTYEGHQWNVKVGEKTVKTFVIDKRQIQRYTI